VACRQPGLSLLRVSKNRSENKGMAHTTTGKNRNTRSVSNRDQTGDASGAERGLHAEEQRPEPTSGGKSEDQAENRLPKTSPARRTKTSRDSGLTKNNYTVQKGKHERTSRAEPNKKNGRGSREKDSRSTQRTKGKMDCTHEIQK
jgi:hypothetical protein